jgi:hypothetical protein
MTWSELQSNVSEGEPIRYWGAHAGFSYGTFTVTKVAEGHLELTIPTGEPIKVYRRDFEKIANLYNDYAKRKLMSVEIKRQTGRSAYIFSLVHELEQRMDRPERTIGDLLTAKSRVFLKSEYGPVSQLWPAVSFSHEGYARELGEEFKAEEDLVLFAGTQNKKITPSKFRERLLCVSRIRPGLPVDSGLLVDARTLASFQDGDTNKFGFSLPVVKAWELPSLPSARQYVGAKYGVIGQGNNRRSYLVLSREEIDKLRQIAISRIWLSSVPIDELNIADESNDLEKQLNRVLARLVARAQQGGSTLKRCAPIRIVSLSKDDLRGLWKQQGGKCKLCSGKIPLDSHNFLLQMSADRIDSDNINYDLTNTQLVHLGCNLGKNSANESDFSEWLILLRNSRS